MDILFSVAAFLLGAVVGSFLNVVIYRLHTGKSINGRSHCLSCGTPLRWFELVPIVSYIVLRGRCRSCGAHIPLRYTAVELVTGASFLGLWHLFSQELLLLVFYLVFASILIVVAVYDLRHTIIPDELTLALIGLAFAFVLFESYTLESVAHVGWSFLGAVFSSLFFAALWFFSRGRWMGLGDAKLAFPFGLLVGFPAAYSMIVFSFLFGAIVSVFLLLGQRILRQGKTFLRYSGIPLTIKSEVPFAPFLIGGFVLVALFNADIFEITFRLLWQI